MIDEYWTFQIFGYHTDNLAKWSKSLIVAVCERCCKYRVCRYDGAGELCHSCAQRGNTKSLGHTPSPETRRKISASQTGNNGNNWQGGLTKWRVAVYNTPSYKNWRTTIFERDDYTCQMCNVYGGKLEAHHIRPVRDHKNDLSMFDIDNGITLCKKCHKSIFNREYDFIEQFENVIGGK